MTLYRLTIVNCRPDGSWICGEPVARCPLCDCKFLLRRSLTLVLKKMDFFFNSFFEEKNLRASKIDYSFHFI